MLLIIENDELLIEIDNIFNNNYFNEDIINFLLMIALIQKIILKK